MATYKISLEAEADLYRIWLPGVREYGEEQADKYYYDFIERFEALAEQPYLYQAVDDIYYRVEGGIVEIMNILGQQDTDGALD